MCAVVQPVKTALEQLENVNISVSTLFVVCKSIDRQLAQTTNIVLHKADGSKEEIAEGSLHSAAVVCLLLVLPVSKSESTHSLI